MRQPSISRGNPAGNNVQLPRGWRSRLKCCLLVLSVQLLSLACVLIALMMYGYDYLAMTEPVKAKMMVLETGLDETTYSRFVRLIRTMEPEVVLIIGHPLSIEIPGNAILDTSEIHKEVIARMGIPETRLVSISVPIVSKGRTIAAALLVRDWCEQHRQGDGSINVVSLDAHARRTRFIFREAMGPGTKVGIVAMKTPQIVREGWYRSSYGVRTVIDEWVAWGYARLFLNYEKEEKRVHHEILLYNSNESNMLRKKNKGGQ